MISIAPVITRNGSVGNSTVIGNGDGIEALHCESAPLTPNEFLAFFWGLHLFGTDFDAVKRFVGTRQVREYVTFSYDSANSPDNVFDAIDARPSDAASQHFPCLDLERDVMRLFAVTLQVPELLHVYLSFMYTPAHSCWQAAVKACGGGLPGNVIVSGPSSNQAHVLRHLTATATGVQGGGFDSTYH